MLPAAVRSRSIVSIRRLSDWPRRAASVESASQNAASSDRLVAWPARTTECLRIPPAGGTRLPRSAARADHVLRPDAAVELLAAHQAEREGCFAQAEMLLVGLLRDLGGIVVADEGIERGHQHQRLVEQVLDADLVGFDADDAIVGEADAGVRQQ